MTPALLTVLRVLPGPPDALRRAVESVNPAELVESAGRHGLGAVLAHALAEAGVALAPGPAQALRQHAASIIGTSLRVKRLLLRVLDALGEAGVVPVVLKGYGFAARHYPDPALRPMSDVDVLIPRALLPRAEPALDSLGLKRKEAPAEAYARAHHHHLDFASPEGMVELHFEALTGFGGVLEGAPLYARATPGRLEGRPVRTLRPEDELVYLATHAAQHFLLRLAWLYDVKLLLRSSPSLAWDEALALAQASRMQSPVFLALSAARSALDAPVPDAVLRALRPPAWQAALFSRLFSPERIVQAPLAGRKWSQYAVNPLMASGMPEMARFALHHLGRGLRRKLALRLPRGWTPGSWRG